MEPMYFLVEDDAGELHVVSSENLEMGMTVLASGTLANIRALAEAK